MPKLFSETQPSEDSQDENANMMFLIFGLAVFGIAVTHIVGRHFIRAFLHNRNQAPAPEAAVAPNYATDESTTDDESSVDEYTQYTRVV